MNATTQTRGWSATVDSDGGATVRLDSAHLTTYEGVLRIIFEIAREPDWPDDAVGQVVRRIDALLEEAHRSRTTDTGDR